MKSYDHRVKLYGPLLDKESRAKFDSRYYFWVNEESDADYVVGSAHQVTESAPEESVQLSPREFEILSFVADGWASAEIAQALSLSLPTIKFHLKSIYKKLGVNRRTEAIREAQKHRIIEW